MAIREDADAVHTELAIATSATISSGPATLSELYTATEAIETALVTAALVRELARAAVRPATADSVGAGPVETLRAIGARMSSWEDTDAIDAELPVRGIATTISGRAARLTKLDTATDADEGALVTATLVGEFAGGSILKASAHAVHAGAVANGSAPAAVLGVAGGVDAAGSATNDAGAVKAGAGAAKARTALVVVLAGLLVCDTGGVERWEGAGRGISWLPAGTSRQAAAPAQLGTNGTRARGWLVAGSRLPATDVAGLGAAEDASGRARAAGDRSIAGSGERQLLVPSERHYEVDGAASFSTDG
jgi:hypothetical protein